MQYDSYILLINRDREVLEATYGSLCKAGYMVLKATDMDGAFSLLNVNPVGLIICDNALQDISGYEFLTILKNDPLLLTIPFVFFVPVHDQGRAFKAFAIGASDFIVYPLDEKTFVERIREIMPLAADMQHHTTIQPIEDVSLSQPSGAVILGREKQRESEHTYEFISSETDETNHSMTPPVTETSLPRPAETDETNHSMTQSVAEMSLPRHSGTVILERDDWRESVRKTSLPPIRIEISRDGVLWMPGQLKNINKQGIFAETSLLVKTGTVLHIKVPSPAGIQLLKGFIRHITFSNPRHPAGIGIEIEETQDWQEVHDYIDMLLGPEDSVEKDKKNFQKNANMQIARRTVILPNPKYNMPANSLLLNDAGMRSEEALDIKFYHSLVGKQLDNYKAVSFIGAGTMGGVFKGWDIALERTVALKVISYELSSHETFRNMFITEARTISQLNHPNIAQIYYIGNTDDILYFAMEFINGKTLADLIKEDHNLDTSKGLKYFITVCLTLDFVSKKNIIHRDIKPDNIMINDKGILKVVDFGVAKITNGNGGETKPEGIVGSPLYMSPDCIKGHTLDCRSDIYSLGATFYHAFSGVPPFEGRNTDDILLKHLNDEPVPLQERNPNISHALSRIIERMMDKEPENRYQDYQGIIDDLEPLIAGNTESR